MLQDFHSSKLDNLKLTFVGACRVEFKIELRSSVWWPHFDIARCLFAYLSSFGAYFANLSKNQNDSKTRLLFDIIEIQSFSTLDCKYD